MRNILILCTSFVLFLTACDKDEDPVDATITGLWKGDRSEVNIRYGIIPVFDNEDEDFDVTLEFRADGTVLFTDEDGQQTTGNYEINGTRLTTDIEFQDDFELEEATFDIDELSNSKLRLSLEEERQLTVPQFGQVDADVTAKLSFDRQ